jgi:hypothetical protein
MRKICQHQFKTSKFQNKYINLFKFKEYLTRNTSKRKRQNAYLGRVFLAVFGVLGVCYSTKWTTFPKVLEGNDTGQSISPLDHEK